MGFILWGIKKEINHHIFHVEVRDKNQIWKGIIEKIRETILVEKWVDEGWKTTCIEGRN